MPLPTDLDSFLDPEPTPEQTASDIVLAVQRTLRERHRDAEHAAIIDQIIARLIELRDS